MSSCSEFDETEEDDLPDPTSSRKEPSSCDAAGYDFAADLKLPIEDELLGPDVPVVEQPARMVKMAQPYDPANDLKLVEEEERARDLIGPSVIAAQQSQPAEGPLMMEQAADAMHKTPAYDPLPDLQLAGIEEEFCCAEGNDSCPLAPREETRSKLQQDQESCGAPNGFRHTECDDYITDHAERDDDKTHHAERDDNYAAADQAEKAIRELASTCESVKQSRSPFARLRGHRRAARAAQQPTGAWSWLVQLETWLAVASLSLVFQIFPAAFWGLLAILDVRNWTWGVTVGVEVAVIVLLLALRVWQTADA
jgi:hypothetical protein